jgi:hypothetical protein
MPPLVGPLAVETDCELMRTRENGDAGASSRPGGGFASPFRRRAPVPHNILRSKHAPTPVRIGVGRVTISADAPPIGMIGTIGRIAARWSFEFK